MKPKYNFHPYDSVTVPKNIIIGCSSDPRVTRYGPTRRNQYLIHYVFSGTGSFNGHTVKAGQGFLTTPGIAEHYYPDEKDPWCYLWFISTDPAIKYFFNQCAADPESGIFQYRNVGVVESIAKRLMTETNTLHFFLYPDSGVFPHHLQSLCLHRFQRQDFQRKALLRLCCGVHQQFYLLPRHSGGALPAAWHLTGISVSGIQKSCRLFSKAVYPAGQAAAGAAAAQRKQSFHF